MDENEVVELEFQLDTADAEKTLEKAVEALRALQTEAETVSAILKKAFSPMQNGLQKVTAGVRSATAAIEKMNATIRNLMDQMAQEQVADQWMGGISTAIEAIAVGMDISKIVGKMQQTDTLNAVVGSISDTIGGITASLTGMTGKLGESAKAWNEQTVKKLADKFVDLEILALYAGDYIKQFGLMIANLAKSTAAWVANTAAKLASKAEDIAIIGLYAGDFVKAMAASVAQLASNTAAWVANAAAKAGSTAAEWAQIAVTTAWTAICGAATAVTSAFGVAMSVLTSPITLVIVGITALVAGIVLLIKNWDTVKDVAIRAWEGIKEAFGSAWSWFESKVLNPLVDGVKGGVNGVIGFINGLIAAAVKGINALINALNKLRFTVPDWVPGLGGETIGFSLNTIKAPQIPYLAKGAVLPANQPFLAMVGDQKHGTNVEAPLATIQEAVAVVLDEQLDALMAGFNATVEELRQLRQTVGNIRVGDDVIGRAADRYAQRRAVMYGTGW